MKNINVKKIVAGAAALAVGASFLGAAVASQVDFGNTITKEDILSNGTPTAKIVVGTGGLPIDVVYAGNIAAAIASKAYKTEIRTTPVHTIPGTPGSTQTYEGDGYLNDRINLALAKPTDNITFSLLNNDYSVLYDDYVNGKLKNDNSYEIRITESLDVNTDGFFSKNKEVKDLLLTVDRQNIKYTLSFDGSGLPYTSTSTSDVYFDSSSKLDLYFMGKKYNVQKIETDGKKITLAEAGSTVVKNSGDVLTVTGSNNEQYTLEIGNAYNDGKKIMLSLKNNGSVLRSGTFEENDDVLFDGYPLKESISIKEILDDTSNANVDLVELSIGEGSLLVLEDGKALPGYKSGSNDLWRVKVNRNTTGAIKYINNIEVFNEAAKWDREDLSSDQAGIVVGESIALPLGLGSVEFLGLTNETTYEFSIGDNEIKWFDKTGRNHSAFMYKDNYDNTSLEIDGQDYYFDVNTAGYMAIRKGNSSTSGFATVKYADASHTFNDTTNRKPAGSEVIGFVGSDNSTVTYYHVTWTASDVILRLAKNKKAAADGLLATYDHGRASGRWNFDGTYLDSEVITTDKNYFDYISSSEAGEKYAKFIVSDGETIIDTEKIVLYVDPYTKGMVFKSDYDVNYVAKVEYTSTSGTIGNWKLDDDKSEDLRFGYTAYGAKIEIDGTKAKVLMPERDLKLKVFVGGGVSTIIEEGEPGSTIGGDEYTVITPVNFDFSKLVVSDIDPEPAGTLIVVGGHMANKAAINVTEEYLTQAGQWIMGKDPVSGKIVVAGYTADDTKSAANAFINAIQ